MQVNFILFQEFFNLLESYYNYLHIKYLHMVCIKKFSLIINNIIDIVYLDKIIEFSKIQLFK